MTFLPIVDRELRVAARKRNTFWVRIIAALVALVIGAGFLTLSHVLEFGTAQMGSALFAVLTWMSLAAALAAGLFFTSDCLSEEKREGTLGFLFLTDLRGYDVVLGKLLATSLRGCFALLAIFPILALTLLMGGVTGPQFWKTLLALVNALFCSLAAGLFVSALSRDSQKALGATLLVMLLLLVGGPIADNSLGSATGRGYEPILSLASPGYVFVQAGRWAGGNFWQSLAVSQTVAWALLGLACVLIPHTWQQRRERHSGSPGGWAYAWRFGGTKRRAALRQKLMSRHPLLWLACRERWQAVVVWTVTLLMAGGFFALLLSDMPSEMWLFWSYLGGALTILFYLAAASQACRFLVEARHNGLMELLLAAPLNGREIVQGQWRALVRMFAAPVTVFLGVQFAATALSYHATWGLMAAMGEAGPQLVVALLALLAKTAVIAANLIALGWFGMWMAMTSKSANFATLKTLLFVQVIPWLVIQFASAMIIPLLLMPALMKSASGSANPNTIAGGVAWFPILFTAVTVLLTLGKDVLFILLARKQLFGNFRELAVRAVMPVKLAIPPPITPTAVARPAPTTSA
ncbi:MAG: ABC transporter permease subunit [Verrucomicrobia bacterium]|nr:ABC transporter permease subunit [Verrucomicrobiota bacterium]